MTTDFSLDRVLATLAFLCNPTRCLLLEAPCEFAGQLRAGRTGGLRRVARFNVAECPGVKGYGVVGKNRVLCMREGGEVPISRVYGGVT